MPNQPINYLFLFLLYAMITLVTIHILIRLFRWAAAHAEEIVEFFSLISIWTVVIGSAIGILKALRDLSRLL